MSTNTLQLRDIFCYMEPGQQIKRIITSFCEATVIDLLETDAMNWRDEFNIKEQDFYDEMKRELRERNIGFSLTIDTSLIMRCIPNCEFEYNRADESSVGLGSKGDVSGIANSWFEITGLFYATADGSEIDLTKCDDLREYLRRELNIE